MTLRSLCVEYRPLSAVREEARAVAASGRSHQGIGAVRDDEEGAAAVRARHEKGYELSPTVVVGNEHMTNPSVRQIREAMARR